MKVYVVAVGAYSDKYISAIFATQELAEGYVLARASHLYPNVPKPPDVSFEAWQKEMGWRATDCGYVEAYDVWSAVPVVVLDEYEEGA